MRAIDTSAWIEWVTGSVAGHRIAPLLPAEDEWLVPTIVQYELAKWRERLPPEGEQGTDVLAFSRLCVVAPLTSPIAINAALLGKEHKLAAADAIVYATAQAFDADLVTCDAHFEGLPGVTYVEKRTN